MGGGGGGSKKSSSSPAPQLQTFDPAALAAAQAQASATQMRMLPETAEKLAGVNREQGALDLRQYVQLLQDPGSVIYGQDIDAEQKRIDAAKKSLSGPKYTNPTWSPGEHVVNPFYGDKNHPSSGYKYVPVAFVEQELKKSEGKVKELKSFDPQTAYDKAFPEIKAEQQALISELQGTLGPTSEYQALQNALDQQYTGERMDRGGLTARTAAGAQIGDIRDVQAAQMGRVDDITANQVGAGRLGQSLMGRAMQMAQSDGRLNAQAERDAVQAARQGMAARGMATGNAALGAELLNRDRFARSRQFEDLAFAQGVQAQDLSRRFQNASNTLAADQANQNVAFNTGQFNASNRQQANMANFEFDANRAAQNAQMRQQNQQFNAQQLAANDVYNQEAARAALTYNNALGMNLQQANLANRFQQANLAQSEQMRQLAAREAIIGQRYASDPMLMLLGAPTPNSQIAGLAAQTTGNAMNMGAQAYSFALNQNNSLYNAYQNNQAAMQAARMQAGATNNAATMGMIGSGVGAAVGIAGVGIAI